MNRHHYPDSHEAELAEAQSACATEPVHIPGAIQPSGGLISFDADLTMVRQVSANLGTLLGIPVEHALRSSPVALLGSDLLKRITRELDERSKVPGTLTACLGAEAQGLHVTPYRSGTRVVVELEPLPAEDEPRLLSVLNRWLATVREAATPDQLLEWLVEEIRDLTGFDRVLIYRFDERWNGSVTAESRGEGIGSFLGHHFPASDIPPQVRALYDRNCLRSIPDAAAAAVPLVPDNDPVDATPLDLSLGVLRAVSPIHQEYLANMDVASALSVALHDEDEERLGALLSCHALATPHRLSPGVRDTVRALVQITVPQLRLLRTRTESQLMQKVQVSRELLHQSHERWIDPDLIVAQRGEEWLDLFAADGVALVHRAHQGIRGSVPDKPSLNAMVAWLSARPQAPVAWYSHCLKETPLAAWHGPSSGLLAVPLPIDTAQPSWLLLFRDEEIETRRWAGLPEKYIASRGEYSVLAPRRSFAEWQEKVRDHCRVWRRSERRAASDLAENLAALIASQEIHLLNARLHEVNERLERLASLDSLTGVWNRYHIEQTLEKEIASATRYGRDCALLLLDVDHFKAVNDDHGHEIGDKALMTLVARLNTMLREADHLGRWGGEEFVVVATGTTARGAQDLAERLRQRVAESHFEEVGPITVSIGVAACRPGDTVKTLVKRADQAMYRAKQLGRNGVYSVD
ncbi:sensor domain-containing diguanylate cyclase [Billgrantia montanilacus]|uniref:sensor domain-containing diguanylate cyclase n=1 Tax=Billgrantia montanilacus TaxID=2282305 RepID=UPI0015EFE0F0|nr:sensor domain-containing diguanylate cyclase [Halomonas montanilacus]